MCATSMLLLRWELWSPLAVPIKGYIICPNVCASANNVSSQNRLVSDTHIFVVLLTHTETNHTLINLFTRLLLMAFVSLCVCFLCDELSVCHSPKLLRQARTSHDKFNLNYWKMLMLLSLFGILNFAVVPDTLVGSMLSDHYKNHVHNKPCQSCSLKFVDNEDLLMHLVQHAMYDVSVGNTVSVVLCDMLRWHQCASRKEGASYNNDRLYRHHSIAITVSMAHKYENNSSVPLPAPLLLSNNRPMTSDNVRGGAIIAKPLFHNYCSVCVTVEVLCDS